MLHQAQGWRLVVPLSLHLQAGAGGLKGAVTAGAWWLPRLCDSCGGGHHNPGGHPKCGGHHSSGKPQSGSGHLEAMAAGVW